MRVRVVAKEDRTTDGIVFDSGAEMRRYVELKLIQRCGGITKLQYQPKFDMLVNGQHICFYSPDFAYVDDKQQPHIEDVKGFKKSKKTGKLLPRINREFGMKRKLLKSLFGLDIEIV